MAFLLAALLAALLAGLAHGGPSTSAGVPEAAVALRRLVGSGGRVAWYHGSQHDLIAYDAVADDVRKDTELYLVRPDGSERRCLTCDVAAIRKGFVGQPAWHPNGEHLVIQVENRNSDRRFYNHVSWGIDNDLWVVRRDGRSARLLWRTPDQHAALHPHFSPDGRRIIFAERLPTGEKLRGALRRLGPDGENQWAGWRIHVADVDLSREENVLSNHRTIQPNGAGFYETHGFAPAGRITYSFTPGGRAYVEDSYQAALDGSGVRNLTRSPGTWEEHAQYSPDGRRLAFISSRMDPALRFPESRARDLRTELFVQDGDGEARQATDMNGRGQGRVAVSDFDWDRDGRRIVFQVAWIDGSRHPEVWIVEWR
jgi:Tol biopolymer transport system component